MKDNREIINIKKLRSRSINMLKDIKESLDTHKIEYWLDFGTLLGAVRDKKVIPWDGDFDLSTTNLSIVENKSLWKEINDKGYNISFSNSNIKILKLFWNGGHYRIDIHRYYKKDNLFQWFYRAYGMCNQFS